MSSEAAQACLNYHIQICLTPQPTDYSSVSQSPPPLDTTLPLSVADEWDVGPTDSQPQARQPHSGNSMYFLKFHDDKHKLLVCTIGKRFTADKMNHTARAVYSPENFWSSCIQKCFTDFTPFIISLLHVAVKLFTHSKLHLEPTVMASVFPNWRERLLSIIHLLQDSSYLLNLLEIFSTSFSNIIWISVLFSTLDLNVTCISTWN